MSHLEDRWFKPQVSHLGCFCTGPVGWYFPGSASYSGPSGWRSAIPHVMTRTLLWHCQHTPAQILMLSFRIFLLDYVFIRMKEMGSTGGNTQWSALQDCKLRQQCKPAPRCGKVCPTRWHHQEKLRVINRFNGLHILVWHEVEVGWFSLDNIANLVLCVIGLSIIAKGVFQPILTQRYLHFLPSTHEDIYSKNPKD